MDNPIIYNAYHVLGLSTTAKLKQAQLAAKHLLAHLGNEQVLELPHDVFDLSRDYASVHGALKKFSHGASRLWEYFFWFQIIDETDQQALTAARARRYEQAIDLWQAAGQRGYTGLNHQKNLAILLTGLLYDHPSEELARTSLQLWATIRDAKDFWHNFFKDYKKNDEGLTEQDELDNCRQQLPAMLIKLYADLSERHDDYAYQALSQKIFKIKANQIEENILGNLCQSAADLLADLSKLILSDNHGHNLKLGHDLNRLLVELQTVFNQILDQGYYYSQPALKLQRDFIKILDSLIVKFRNLGYSRQVIGLALVNKQLRSPEHLALDFDLSFLRDSQIRPDLKTIIQSSTKLKNNQSASRWRAWFFWSMAAWVAMIGSFVFWYCAQPEPQVAIGNLVCSRTIAALAKDYPPPEAVKNQIQVQDQELIIMSQKLDALEKQMSAGAQGVSDSAVAAYNKIVSQHNDLAKVYQAKKALEEQTIGDYNQRVADYQKFLQTNCQKK